MLLFIVDVHIILFIQMKLMEGMKMKFEKLLKGGFAVMLAVSMMACSGNESSNGGSSDEGNASEPSGETSDVAKIKVGMSGPLTGDAAIYGVAVQRGAEIAIEELNDLGNEIQFELNAQDDEADPEKSPNAYGVLKDWGMQISLGCVTSGAGAAVSADYQADKIFAITPSGSSTDVIFNSATNEPYGNVFQMCFTDPNQGVASADYLKAHEDLGTKVAVIWKNDDNYSTGVYNKFIARAEEVGLEVVSDTTFSDANANDFSVQVKDAQDSGADVLFLPIYYTPAAQILIAADQAGYKPTVFGIDGMDGILGVENFDTSLAEGVYLLTPFSADATDPQTVSFVSTYQEKYGEIPNQFAADAYDVVYAYYNACKNAGITADMSAQDICDKMVEQFTTMTFDGITGTGMTWSENGEVSKDPKAMVIQNGAYVGVND